ncbi:uncharacterized protein KQ657_000275 [Scheffersomyces spartinae]|uniref:Eukaryotic translation initiation factor 3 subunit H n=1 Tax=Scheffersomyces spartinae TaxID=45513 RepID=A0A9P8AK99_9ASCO|nr:uncharacterized protein KQ657_000275 [Scheffersomyces spartinae]KAG7196260.1 hypothetical protein KQ657_000275 [Scheffersomyces spartinae]
MASTQKVYTAPTATSVEIEGSALLSVVKHSSSNYPSLFSGTLLGFRSDEGTIDITHAYPYPYPDQYEGGLFKSKSGAKYQQEIQETLKGLGYGVEFQGWFQSTFGGNFVTTQLVDSLAQQQLSNANAFVLILDMVSINKELDVKALRLTESFIKTYIDGKWKTKELATNELTYQNIFEEIPVIIRNLKLVNLFLSSQGPSLDDSYDILNMSSNQNVNTQLLESLYSQVDALNYDQSIFNYYQRQLQKEMGRVQQWKNQRRLDNLERAKNGEKELDPEEWKSLFRLPNEPSRYNSTLHSYAIDVLADDILKKCDHELTNAFAIERNLVQN